MKNVQTYSRSLLYILIFLIFALYFIKAECTTGQIDSSNNKYCDLSGAWQPQKADGVSCQNNYECSIGSCQDGKCQSIDIIKELETQQGIIQSISNYFFPPPPPPPPPPPGGGSDIECGNNDKETGEVCDRNDVAGKNCYILGFTGGTLKCATNCTAWNTTGCFVSTPQAPQPTCTPVCSSTCGGEPSGCGTNCIYNNGAYCGDNGICDSGTCAPKPECESDSDCAENEICSYNKCVQKPKKPVLTPTLIIIFVLILLGLLILGIVYIIKKFKKKSISKTQVANKKSFY